jgi:hypothetical protein
MDIVILTKALVALLAPLLPFLIKAGEKSVEEIGKKVGESAWNLAKKIWSRLAPKINANPAAKESVNDLIKSPKDDDYIAAFRVQIKKLLESDPSLAKELYSQLNNINNAARDININIGNINVNGNVYGGNFVGGTGNVFQNGTNNYHYTVNVGKIDRVVFGKENRIAEMQEVELSFLQPDGTYPKHSWVDKANTLEIMFGQNSKIANEKWEPSGFNSGELRKLLMTEINRWTLKGWELVEADPEKLFLSDYNSAETIGSALGNLLKIPTGLAWNHWRIYYGARFHVRRFID